MSRADAMAPDARRTQLLDASRSVFARKGYHNASVADIVTAAGVARGTFYNYFPGKRAAFQAVLDDLMVVVATSVHAIDPTKPIPAQLRENLTRLIAALTGHGDVSRILFGHAPGIDREGDAALRSFYADVLARIEHALRLGQGFGVITPGDPALMARCLLGLLKEPAFQASLHEEVLDAEALVDAISAFLARGVLVPGALP